MGNRIALYVGMANGKALATPKITYPGATRDAEKGGKKDV